MELATIAERAVQAAQAAGATDAEAYVQDSVGREIRVFDGEVESLTDAGQRGLGVRCWIDHRSGYAYGTDLSDEGLSRHRRRRRRGGPDRRSGRVHRRARGGRRRGGRDRGARRPEPRGLDHRAKIELAQAVERAARAADERVVAVETTVYADEEERVALASSTGLSGSWEATSAYAYLQAIAEADGDKQTGLGLGMGRSPQALDPEEIGREGGERAASLLGATKPSSRTCPVVLDPLVAASFVGIIGGTLCADAVQRGRSPFAGMLGEEVGSAALTLTDDGIDPTGLNSAPLDAEGAPRGSTSLIEAGTLAAYLHDSYTARRAGRRDADDRERIALGLPLAAVRLHLQSDRRAGGEVLRGAPGRGGGRRLRHRRRRPSLRREPGLGHLLGRGDRQADRGRGAGGRGRRVHDRLGPHLDAEGGRRRRA